VNDQGRSEVISPDGPQPVFILTPIHSYSTVTVAVFAGHPEIYCFPELLLFSAPTVGEVLAGVIRRNARPRITDPRFHEARRSGLFRSIAEVHEGSQDNEAIGRARAWLIHRAGWPSERLYDYLIEKVRPQVPLEKSPDTVTCPANLTQCLRSYPSARFIHLTRHPAKAVASIQRHTLVLYPGSSPRLALINAASVWYKTHLMISRTLAELPEKQWYRVRAEDIMQHPRHHIPGILDWLELESSDETVDRMLHTERWRFAGKGASGELFGGDYRFMSNPQLRAIEDPGPIPATPWGGVSDEMWRRIRVLAGYLGYD
jgi:Sulfotransferase family